MESKKMGRPKSDQPKSERVQVRFTEAEMTRIQEYAAEHNLTITQLIREGTEKLIGAGK